MIKEKIVINDHVQGDPLSEENLDKTLNFLYEILLLFPDKTIWLYTGYEFEEILKINMGQEWNFEKLLNDDMYRSNANRYRIIKQCDVLVDGRYIDSQRNISAKWKGSDNQRVIDVQKSLKQRKVVLYCD